MYSEEPRCLEVCKIVNGQHLMHKYERVDTGWIREKDNYIIVHYKIECEECKDLSARGVELKPIWLHTRG